MSETIQKSKYITVQEFMPKWTELKERVGDKSPTRMEEDMVGVRYTDGSRCLIGEAYGFEDDQYGGCEVCNDFSYSKPNMMYSKASEAKNGTLREFYEFKEEAYEHYMEHHPDKLLRRK
jgi:hypothetical protein